jgi:hypothetical protein
LNFVPPLLILAEKFPRRPNHFSEKDNSASKLAVGWPFMAEQPVRFVQRPEWQHRMGQIVQNIMSLQPTVTIHRSKLFAVFDDFRPRYCESANRSG